FVLPEGGDSSPPMNDPRLAPVTLPPVFDAGRAQRVLDDLANSAPEIAAERNFRALLEAASGNSPYLARLIVQESAFLAQYRAKGPDEVLASLVREALAAQEHSEIGSAMQQLRLAKRRSALAIALADIAGLYDLQKVTAALTRFADASVT